MNTTTPTVDNALYNQSYTELMAKAFSAKVHLCVAPVAFTIDLLIICTIWRTKDLHNKSHLLMLSVSMAHAIYTSQTGILALRVLVRIHDSTPLIIQSWLCILNVQLQYLPFGAFAALGLNLAIDRFMCVMTPIFYRQIDTKWYILIINLVAYLYNILIMLLSMIGTDIYVLSDCENAGRMNYNAAGTIYSTWNGNVRLGLAAILYVSTACVLLKRYKSANLSESTHKSEWRRQWEIRVFTAMCADGAVSILVRLAQSVPYFISSQQTDARVVFALTLVAASAGYIDGMAHLGIYLVVDKGFRQGFREAVLNKFRRNAVTALVQPR